MSPIRYPSLKVTPNILATPLTILATSLFALLFVLHFASPSGFAGHRTGNGAGLSEQNIAYSFINLDRFFARCNISPNCAVTNDQKTVLLELIDLLPFEYAHGGLSFLPEKGNESRFGQTVRGEIRTFNTDSAPGSKILVNLDKIDKKDSAGNVVHMKIPEATNNLIAILANRLSPDKASIVKSIASRVSAIIQSQIKKSHLGRFGRPEVQLIFLSNEDHSTSIAFSESVSVFQFDLKLRNSLICRNAEDHPGDLFSLTNPYQGRLSTYDANNKIQLVTFYSDIEYQCHTPNGVAIQMQGSMRLDLPLNAKSADWQFNDKVDLELDEESILFDFFNLREK